MYKRQIEAMAHLTLEGTADKYRLSLGGIYAPREGSQARPFKKPLALESFLGRHPEIEEIEICLNNDFAGRWAAEHPKQYSVAVGETGGTASIAVAADDESYKDMVSSTDGVAVEVPADRCV